MSYLCRFFYWQRPLCWSPAHQAYILIWHKLLMILVSYYFFFLMIVLLCIETFIFYMYCTAEETHGMESLSKTQTKNLIQKIVLKYLMVKIFSQVSTQQGPILAWVYIHDILTLKKTMKDKINSMVDFSMAIWFCAQRWNKYFSHTVPLKKLILLKWCSTKIPKQRFAHQMVLLISLTFLLETYKGKH